MHATGWIVLGIVGAAGVGAAVYVLTRPVAFVPLAPQTPEANSAAASAAGYVADPVTGAWLGVQPQHPTRSGGGFDLGGAGQAIGAVVGIVGMFV